MSARANVLHGLGCLAALVLLAAPAPAQERGRRRALLIGIDEYRSETLPPLRGAVNDTETIAHLLVTRFGFAAPDVRTLINRAATRSAILGALAQLVQDAGPADCVYVHFSGHGSQVADLNGDEEDGMDETLVPHDGRTDGIPDVVDDELDAILARLRAGHALVVLDSCHSGTGTREGGSFTSRRVPPDGRTELYRALTTRGGVRGGQPYVLLTAAAADEPALDGPLEGRPHGVFTYALARTLGNLGAGASPRRLLAGVEQEYRRLQELLGLATMPRPQLEAPAERLEVAVLPPLAQEPARLPWLRVLPGSATGEALLEGGGALGANVGSAWAIHPPLDVAFAPGSAIASGEVVRVEGRNACLRLAPGPGAADLTDCRAVASAPARPTPVTVRLAPPGSGPKGGRKIADALRTELGKVAHLVDDRAKASFAVTLADGALHVLGSDGKELLATAAAAADIHAVARVLGRSGVAAELLSLDHPSSSMTVRTWAGDKPPANETAVTTRGVKVVANTGPTVYRVRLGDEPRTQANSLILNVRAGQECYVTVVDVDAEGELNLLFPNDASAASGFLPEGKILADQDIRIPDSLAEDNLARFWFDYCEPPGTDTVRVFATGDLATANEIRAAVREVGAAAAAQGEGAVERSRSRLAELRSRLLAFATRGVKVVAAKPAAPSGGSGAAASVASGASDSVATAPGAATAAAPASSAGDWTAASINLTVKAAR